MATLISILILIICFLLALVVLAQNPKGGGLASGFTGAQQIGGVQRTADFLEKGTWTMAGALMVLCLVSSAFKPEGSSLVDDLDTPTEQLPTTSGTIAPDAVNEEPPAPDAGAQDEM